MLVDVSLRQAERDGKCGVLDLSIITPVAESYCAGAAKQPLHAAKIREDVKILKYLQAYISLDDIHFEPFVVKSGGQATRRKSPRNIQKDLQSNHPNCKFCPNIAQSTGNICGARLDSRDLHLRTCKINNVIMRSMKRSDFG